MNRIVIILLLMFTATQLWSQTEFKEAFIITNVGDTVRVWAKYDEGTGNMNECRYKLHPEDELVRTYYPGDIVAYRFVKEGRFFVTKTVKFNSGEIKTAFFEYLIKGVKDLYYYRDGLEYFLFESRNAEPVLVSKGFDYLKNGRLTEDTKYRETLKAVFSDMPELFKKIEKLTIGRASMIDLARAYHNKNVTDGSVCEYFPKLKPGIIPGQLTEPLKFEFSAAMGPVLQRRNFYQLVDNTTEPIATSLIPEINVQGEIIFPNQSYSYGLFLQLTANNTAGKKSYFKDYLYSHYFHVFRYNGFAVSECAGIKFQLGSWKLRPVVEAGYVLTQYPVWESQLDTYLPAGNSINKRTFDNYMKMKPGNGFMVALRFDYMLYDSYKLFLKASFASSSYDQQTNLDDNSGIYKSKKFYENNFGLKLGYIF